MAQYVYLLQTREFINSRQPIYKIGRTKQANFKRFGNYDKGFVMLFQGSCRDCEKLEKQIIILFSIKYERRLDLGQELFEGDQLSMMGDMCDIVRNEGVEKTAQDDNGSNDTNNDMSTTQGTHVSNAVVEEITESITQDALVSKPTEDEDDTEDDEEGVPVELNANEDYIENVEEVLSAREQKMLNCIPCGLSTNNKYYYAQHLKKPTHIDRMQNSKDYDNVCMHCFKTYRSIQRLLNHQRRYRTPKPVIPKVKTPPKTKLRTEVGDVEGITREMSSKCNVIYQQLVNNK